MFTKPYEVKMHNYSSLSQKYQVFLIIAAIVYIIPKDERNPVAQPKDMFELIKNRTTEHKYSSDILIFGDWNARVQDRCDFTERDECPPDLSTDLYLPDSIQTKRSTRYKIWKGIVKNFSTFVWTSN